MRLRLTVSILPALALLASGCTTTEPASDGEAGASTEGSEAGEGEGEGEGETTGADPDSGVWEIRMPNFSPGAHFSTWYGCYSQTFQVEEGVHLTGFVPKVDDPHVHHYVVQLLDEATNDDPATPCIEEPWEGMIWGWAPGGEELQLPEHVGMPAGENGLVNIRFQVHYDNPLHDKFYDNGGFDVHWTKNKREHDAGIVTFGDITNINIPAGEPAHEHLADCPPSFSEAYFPEQMNVIGTWLHAHEIGSVLWGEIIPGDGGDPYELGREDPYRFDYQTFRPTEATLYPGDQVNVHCVYDNSGNEDPVQGGPRTEDEMCVNFVMYYPKVVGLDECGAL